MLPALTLMFAIEAADGGGAPAPPPPPIPACVQVETASRYVPYGYNHVVILKNGCSKWVTCNVSTDVNPEVQRVDVAPNSTVEVVTFMAAPNPPFVARVTCKLK